MPSDILFTAGDHRAILLRPEQDTAALQALSEACADYSELVEGHAPPPTAAQEMFGDRPPGKTPDDKFLIGLFDPAGSLVGVLDAIRSYPEPGEWFIGLLLLHPGSRSHGLGDAAYHAFEAWAAAQGAQQIGIGVVEANEKACRFWSRLGFETIRKSPPRVFGQKEHVVIYMRRAIGG